MKKLTSLLLTTVMIMSLFAVNTVLAANDSSEVEDNNEMMQTIHEDDVETFAATKNNVIVVVPGIMGSELKVGNTVVWSPNIININMLRCNDLGVSQTTVNPYNSDNYGAQDTYKELYNNLKSNFGDRFDVLFYAYDWRMSSGGTSATNLKSLVSKYTGNIVFVAHSMGGLVSSKCISLETTAQRNRTTLITLGTPFMGAPKAVQVFETGKMDLGFPGDVLLSDTIQRRANNFPASWELLPSSRFNGKFISVDGTVKTYADAIKHITTRDWAVVNISGSMLGKTKPMLANAQSFMNAVYNNGNQYPYMAAHTYHIITQGYTTVTRANYTKDSSGVYKMTSVTTSNSGDGTVPEYSARNGQGSNVVISANLKGNHGGMVSNAYILSQVKNLIGQSTLDTAVASTNGLFGDLPDVNVRGWLMSDEVDGRRIEFNINGINDVIIMDGSDKELQIAGENIYNQEGDLVGNVWDTEVGYQFSMMDGKYRLVLNGLQDENEVLVSYMEDGYYNRKVDYSGFTEPTVVELSACSQQSVKTYQVNQRYTDDENITIAPIKIYTENELNELNAD